MMIWAWIWAWLWFPRLRRLTPHEESIAGQIVQNGPPELATHAREILVMHNLPLVSHITTDVRRQARDPPPFIELFSEGVIGLNEAADRYDGRTKFSKYAFHFIRSKILQAITTMKTPCLTHREAILHNRMKKTRFQLAQTLGRGPTLGEVAGELNMTEAAVSRLSAAASQQTFDVLSQQQHTSAALAASPLSPIPYFNLHELSPIERQIFVLRFFRNFEIRQIAKLMSVSDETIRLKLNGPIAEKLRNSERE